MINADRMVPVTNIDLISLYGLILLQAGKTIETLDAVNPSGDFELTAEPAASTYVLATEPVATFDFAAGVDTAMVYFVPGYDFSGFTADGSAAAIASGSEDVVNDPSSLYLCTWDSGEVTIEKVGY